LYDFGHYDMVPRIHGAEGDRRPGSAGAAEASTPHSRRRQLTLVRRGEARTDCRWAGATQLPLHRVMNPRRHIFHKQETMASPREQGIRTAVLIDGAHLHACAEAHRTVIDFRKLRDAFQLCGTLTSVSYFAPLDSDLRSALQPLISWLPFNGFRVIAPVSRPSRPNPIPSINRVDLVVQMMTIARRVQSIVLLAGDDDYRPVIKSVQRKGRRVTAISTRTTSPPLIGDALRRQVDSFMDIELLLPHVVIGKRTSGS
jgi:hypothetical protein